MAAACKCNDIYNVLIQSMGYFDSG